MFWFDCKITIFFLKMARKRTFSHFFFEKKCVFVPKSLIWLPREGCDVFWPIWNASTNKNQWGGSDDVQYLAAYSVEAGEWKTLTWKFTAQFPLDVFQFVFGGYTGNLDIDDLVLVKDGITENLIDNGDFSKNHIQGWSTNWQGPSYYLANDAYQSTGITQPSVVAQPSLQDDAYYTLQGVRVSHPTSGVFIHKGRKIVMK